MTKIRAIVIVGYCGLAIAGIACGSDATRLTATPDAAAKTDVTGRWNYTATNVTGPGVNCSISGVTIGLTQTGSSLQGNSTGGVIACTINGAPISGSLDTEIIANGKIDKTVIEFDIGDSNVHNVGSVTGNSITGTVSIQFSMSGGVVPITGPFVAVRQ